MVQKYELPLAPVVFELELDALKAACPAAVRGSLALPAVVRDLAIVVDQNVAPQTLLDGLAGNRPALVTDIGLFDVYTGKGVDSGKKSLLRSV